MSPLLRLFVLVVVTISFHQTSGGPYRIGGQPHSAERYGAVSAVGPTSQPQPQPLSQPDAGQAALLPTTSSLPVFPDNGISYPAAARPLPSRHTADPRDGPRRLALHQMNDLVHQKHPGLSTVMFFDVKALPLFRGNYFATPFGLHLHLLTERADHRGFKAEHVYAEQRRVILHHICERFVSYRSGFNPDAASIDTMLDWAIVYKELPVIPFLIFFGASVTEETVLRLLNEGNVDTAQYLMQYATPADAFSPIPMFREQKTEMMRANRLLDDAQVSPTNLARFNGNRDRLMRYHALMVNAIEKGYTQLALRLLATPGLNPALITVDVRCNGVEDPAFPLLSTAIIAHRHDIALAII